MEVIKLVEKLDTAQQVTATLSPPTGTSCPMMTTVLSAARRVILVTIYFRNNATAVMILAILPKTAIRKLPHQGHPIIKIDLTPNHIIATATGTGHTPFTTDRAKGTALTVQDHVTYLSTTEVPVITEGMHPTLYPITKAVLVTPLQTDTPTGTSSTTPGAMHLDTHYAKAIHDTTPPITVDLGPRHSSALLIDCSQGRY